MADLQGDVMKRGDEEDDIPIPPSKFLKIKENDIEKKKFIRRDTIGEDDGKPVVVTQERKKERRHNTEILRTEVVSMLSAHQVKFSNEAGDSSEDDSGGETHKHEIHQFERKSLTKNPRRSILKHKDVKLEALVKGLGEISEEKEEYSPVKKQKKILSLEQISNFEEFQQGWKYFQVSEDLDGLIVFLKKIDCKEIGKVFPDGMEIVLKTEIMRKLDILADKDPVLVKNLVFAFPSIKFFELKMKCLMPKEKSDIKRTIEKLQKLKQITNQETENLFAVYKI